MKTAWSVLLVSALTDFLILTGTSLSAAMVATGTAAMPNKAVVMLSLIGGVMAFSRTIQQALKTTPETHAALTGAVSVTTTSVEEKTP